MCASSLPFRRLPPGAVLLAALFLGGCGDGPTAAPPGVRLVITPSTARLTHVGDTVTLQAFLEDSPNRALSAGEVAWESADPGVVRVDARGRATGTGAGSALVLARLLATEFAGATGVAVVSVAADTVPPRVTELTASPTRVSVLNRAGPVTLTARFEDAGSGVLAAVAHFTGPGGASITGLATFTRVEGTPRSGLWKGFLTIPANSDPGWWDLTTLLAEDGANNTLAWERAELEAAGFSVRIQAVWAR
ncbi:MAG: Ig domain-containing protein [Gemmatimonadota bacterium]